MNTELAPNISSLPRQQYRIALLLLQCMGNKEIGERMGLSEKTVKSHMTQLMKAFGVKSRLQLYSRLADPLRDTELAKLMEFLSTEKWLPTYEAGLRAGRTPAEIAIEIMRKPG